MQVFWPQSQVLNKLSILSFMSITFQVKLWKILKPSQKHANKSRMNQLTFVNQAIVMILNSSSMKLCSGKLEALCFSILKSHSKTQSKQGFNLWKSWANQILREFVWPEEQSLCFATPRSTVILKSSETKPKQIK